MRVEANESPKTIYLKDYTPAPFLVKHVDLSFALFEEKTVVTASVQYTKRVIGSGL